jgi:hypothetical protein
MIFRTLIALLLLGGSALAQVGQGPTPAAGVPASALTTVSLISDGVTDNAPAINTAIAANSVSGGGIVQLGPASNAVTGTIVPKSNVWLRGAGQAQGTLLKCNANCVAQDSTVQLASWHMSDINFQPVSGHESVTVLTFSSMQQSTVERLLIEGFTTGRWLNLGGTIPSTVPETNLGTNVIWDTFRDITVYGCATCATLSGHYGSTPTGSPANSANVPDQVVSQNRFLNVNIFDATTICIDMVRATDTNDFFGGLCKMSANTGGIAVAHGDDGSFTGNTYVNSNKFFGFAISAEANVTAMTLWYSQNYTFALEAYGFETDINTAGASIVPLALTTAQSYRLCGKRLDTNSTITNLFLGCQTKGIAWTLLANSGPSTGFTIAIPPGSNSYGLTTNGTLATGQLQMPCGAPDGQVISIWSTATIVTSLTMASCSGAGSSLAGAPTSLSPTTPFQMRFIASSNFWVRN